MKTFKIEKNKPIPTSGSGRKNWRYPFPDMAIGDSFFVPITDDVEPLQLRSRVYQAASQFAKRTEGFKFTTAKEPGGVRCWRIEP